jgi:transcription termination/antitermination protein NusG
MPHGLIPQLKNDPLLSFLPPKRISISRFEIGRCREQRFFTKVNCDLLGEAMAANDLTYGTLSIPPTLLASEPKNWYALHTRPKHERLTVHRLAERGVETFLPTITEEHRWSDRKKRIQLPLFSCYVFARFTPNKADRLRVLRVAGVLCLVGSGGEGTPIPDQQIDAVRSVMESALPWACYPFLKIGQRVRVCSGSLAGMEGVLVSRDGSHSLVISVDAIHRSLAVRIEGYELEPA